MLEGRLYESVRVAPNDRVAEEQLEVPVLHRIDPEGVRPTLAPELGLPLAGTEEPNPLDFLHLTAADGALWGAAGEGAEGGGEVTVVRRAEGTWSQVLGPASEPSGAQLFPREEAVNAIAAEPGAGSAWLALDSHADARQPSPSTPALLARVSAALPPPQPARPRPHARPALPPRREGTSPSDRQAPQAGRRGPPPAHARGRRPPAAAAIEPPELADQARHADAPARAAAHDRRARRRHGTLGRVHRPVRAAARLLAQRIGIAALRRPRSPAGAALLRPAPILAAAVLASALALTLTGVLPGPGAIVRAAQAEAGPTPQTDASLPARNVMMIGATPLEAGAPGANETWGVGVPSGSGGESAGARRV